MAGIIKVNQYQDFNGNTLFTSDGNGNLTTQEIMYPAFHVEKTSDQDISEATDTKVTWDSSVIDTNSAFSTSDNKFTVPSGKAGKYVFYGALQTSSVGQSEYQFGFWYVYKNGSKVSQHFADNRNNNLRDISAVFNFTIDLAVSDYIEIYAHLGTSGSNQRIKGQSSPAMTWFSGYRIGA